MSLEELFALGVTSVAGQLAFKNKVVGSVNRDGEVSLVPDVEEILGIAKAKNKGGRPRKVDVPAGDASTE